MNKLNVIYEITDKYGLGNTMIAGGIVTVSVGIGLIVCSLLIKKENGQYV